MKMSDSHIKVLEQYQRRVDNAVTRHSDKFKQIRDARKQLKQIMPETMSSKLASSDSVPGNNISNASSETNSGSENRSKYVPPIALAIFEKIIADLTASPVEFDYMNNIPEAKDKSDAFMDILKRTFTQENVLTEHVAALYDLLASGTLVVQPVSKMMGEAVLKEQKNEETGEVDIVPQLVSSGRGLGFYRYDPLTTILDPDADPFNVTETSNWAVVTLGMRTAEYIKERYNKNVAVQEEVPKGKYAKKGSNALYLIIDNYKMELEQDSGLSHESLEGFRLREYFTTDGKVYTILEDRYVLEERWNSSRIYGKIPLIVCQGAVDPESPYGVPLGERLRKSIDLISTAINLVADNTALRNKLPWVTIKGAIDPMSMAAFKSGQTNNLNSIIELNPQALKIMSGSGINVREVSNLFQKPQLQEVTEGAMFLYSEGIRNISQVTGLNLDMLGGRQDKQIRIQSVADMISQSALKNSSQIVKNLDIHYYNNLCRAFQRMFYVYYADFNEFKVKEVPEEIVADMKNVRIKNGSYLPADQMSIMQRAGIVLERMNNNPMSYDPVKVEKTFIESLGLNFEDFMRDPAAMLDENIVTSLLQKLQELGPEGFAEWLVSVGQAGGGQ